VLHYFFPVIANEFPLPLAWHPNPVRSCTQNNGFHISTASTADFLLAEKEVYKERASSVQEDSCQQRLLLFYGVFMNREIPMVRLLYFHKLILLIEPNLLAYY